MEFSNHKLCIYATWKIMHFIPKIVVLIYQQRVRVPMFHIFTYTWYCQTSYFCQYNGISLWSSFAYPWFLRRLRIFPCSWQFVFPLLWDAYYAFLPIFLLVSFSCKSIRIIKIKNILYILDTNLLLVLWTTDISSKPLQSFYLLHGVFNDQNFTMKYNKMCLFHMSGTFWVLLKKSLPPQSQTDFFICFLLEVWEFHYS